MRAGGARWRIRARSMASLVVSDPKLTLASDGKFLPEIVSGGRLCSAKASARRDVVTDPELTPPRGEKFFPGIVSGDRYDCCPGSFNAHATRFSDPGMGIPSRRLSDRNEQPAGSND